MFKRLLIVVLLLALAFGGVGYWKFQKFQQMKAQLAAPRPPATVASVEVKQENWQPRLRSVGSVVAQNGIDVTNEVAGVVASIAFESGQRVKAGEVLLKLEDSVEQATLASLRADRRLAEVQYKRAADLIPKQAVSKADFDIAKATFDAAQARVAEQEAVIAKKIVRAPFSGLLGIRRVDLGQFLQVGTSIVGLQALDPLYVDYTLPERDFRRVASGQTVELTLDAYPGETFQGKVTAVDSGVDEGTRAIRVRATVPNPDNRLRPGMFAEGQTLLPVENQVLTVPRTAISFNTYGDFAYVIEKGEDGSLTVKRRQVTTDAVQAGWVQVTKGLQAGETVVRTGLVKLRDGVPVAIDNSVELKDGEVAPQ